MNGPFFKTVHNTGFKALKKFFGISLDLFVTKASMKWIINLVAHVLVIYLLKGSI